MYLKVLNQRRQRPAQQKEAPTTHKPTAHLGLHLRKSSSYQCCPHPAMPLPVARPLLPPLPRLRRAHRMHNFPGARVAHSPPCFRQRGPIQVIGVEEADKERMPGRAVGMCGAIPIDCQRQLCAAFDRGNVVQLAARGSVEEDTDLCVDVCELMLCIDR